MMQMLMFIEHNLSASASCPLLGRVMFGDAAGFIVAKYAVVPMVWAIVLNFPSDFYSNQLANLPEGNNNDSWIHKLFV